MRINSQIGNSLRHPTKLLSEGIDSGKKSAIESMIEDGYTPSLKGPNPAQREQLHSGLSKVDHGVLLWAQQQGVKIQVLQEGEVLEQADVLRDLTGKFEQRIDPGKVDQIAGHLSDLTEKIRTETDPEENKKWRIQKRNQLAEILTANPCGAAVFTPTFAPLLAPGLSKLMADPTETPTLKSLALHHGADSPQEQKQFYQWMERLNGKRLTTARQAAVQEKSKLLSARPDAQKRWLDQAQKHPELVPLDVTLHTIVVPDAHFFPSHDGGDELLLDRSDLSSIKGWRDKDFRGQWFFLEGKSHILVRDDAVGLHTPTHELGHVVDMKLEKTAPDFYSRLKPRIEKSFYQARLHNRTVTQYSRANPREYIAEGFAAYYNQPQGLREKDPELHQIIKEMVDYCCQEAGWDKNLDSKLQRMRQDAAGA